MNLAAVPASLGAADPAPAAAPPDAAVEASPAAIITRMSVDARGLALGILMVLALIFALSWAQAFVVPRLLGIIIS